MQKKKNRLKKKMKVYKNEFNPDKLFKKMDIIFKILKL